jgi:predicted transcriptional regulator
VGVKKREPILMQMEILASLFASPKLITRLAQSCNINLARMTALTGPMLAKGLIRTQIQEGQEVYAVTDEGYRLYMDWLEIWRRMSLE